MIFGQNELPLLLLPSSRPSTNEALTHLLLFVKPWVQRCHTGR
jgi:hypothetical protein